MGRKEEEEEDDDVEDLLEMFVSLECGVLSSCRVE